MKRNKYNRGNTMPITLIILIIVSIISLGITYMVAQTSATRIRRSTTEINQVRLANDAYVVINSANDYYLTNSSLEGFSDSSIFNVEIKDDLLSFAIKKDFYGKILNVKIQYSATGYQILKWEEQ